MSPSTTQISPKTPCYVGRCATTMQPLSTSTGNASKDSTTAVWTSPNKARDATWSTAGPIVAPRTRVSSLCQTNTLKPVLTPLPCNCTRAATPAPISTLNSSTWTSMRSKQPAMVKPQSCWVWALMLPNVVSPGSPTLVWMRWFNLQQVHTRPCQTMLTLSKPPSRAEALISVATMSTPPWLT